MKWAQRYSVNDDGEMVASDSGSWVEYAYYEYLKAEVERLRKAGDLLAFHYISLGRKVFPTDPLPSSIDAWNAAKEGKPDAGPRS